MDTKDKQRSLRHGIPKTRISTTLFVLSIITMGIMLLMKNGNDRVDAFSARQLELAKHSVSASANEVNLLIKEFRRSVNLFASEEHALLSQLAVAPGDTEKYYLLDEKINTHFPEYLTFTLANSNGDTLLEGFEGLVGKACKIAIQDFSLSRGEHKTHLHKSPEDKPYHYDIMTFWGDSKSEKYIFFISLKTENMTRILSNTEVVGHQLMLVRNDESNMIDITGTGNRKNLERDTTFSPGELDRISYSAPIAGTAWKVVNLPDANLLGDAHSSIWIQTLQTLAAFLAISSILLLLIKREEKRRTIAEVELVTAYDQMEDKVLERTRELSDANDTIRISEERYRDLFDHANDLIQSSSPDGSILYANNAWCKTLGYSQSELDKLSIFDVIHPDSLEHCKEMLQRVLSGECLDNFEFTLITKDGRVVNVEGSTSCNFKDGKPQATRGIYRDITERKKSEEESVRHREELSRVTRLSTIGEMASALAHELNQPLSSIANYTKGCIERLKNEPSDLDPVLDVMKKTCDEAERTGEFIRHLADFVSKGEFEKNTIDISSLIHRAVSLADPELKHSRTQILLKLEQNLPDINADAIEIEQVILNLVRNSLESMQQAGVEKKVISIQASKSKDGYISVSVQDNGVGIPQENIGHIFDPFYTTKKSGMGLGLSISRSIIAAHDGKLWADTEQPQGARFLFNLPVLYNN